MICKRMTYTDYNGQERTEDFFFNLRKDELIRMEVAFDGGLSEHLRRMVDSNNRKEILALLEDIVQKSYGIKSPDGRRHIKNQEVLDAFVESEAYSDLIVSLMSDAEMASAFINGIVPQNMGVITSN